MNLFFKKGYVLYEYLMRYHASYRPFRYTTLLLQINFQLQKPLFGFALSVTAMSYPALTL